jgi:hypothetical protein
MFYTHEHYAGYQDNQPKTNARVAVMFVLALIWTLNRFSNASTTSLPH